MRKSARHRRMKEKRRMRRFKVQEEYESAVKEVRERNAWVSGYILCLVERHGREP